MHYQEQYQSTNLGEGEILIVFLLAQEQRNLVHSIIPSNTNTSTFPTIMLHCEKNLTHARFTSITNTHFQQ